MNELEKEKKYMYLVKKFCDMVGVTFTTLRYYERIGLLDPMKNADNSYRNYFPEDAFRVNNFKYYRSLGYDTKTSLELTKKPEEGFVRKCLKERESELIDELLLARSRIDAITRQTENMEHIHEERSFWIGHREEMLFLQCSEANDFDMSQYDRMSEWVRLLPITRYSKVMPDQDEYAHYGISIEQRYAYLLEEEERKDVIMIPGGECLYYYSAEIGHPITRTAIIHEIEAYAKEQGMIIGGDIYIEGSKAMNAEKKRGQIVCIPIKLK